MSEIADLIEKMYGHHYTPQTMSNITKSFTEEVTAFKGRELHDRYLAYLYGRNVYSVKAETVAKEAIHIAVGIRPDGSKEVLSYAIAPTESITIWEEILLDLPRARCEKCPPVHHGWLKGDGRSDSSVLSQSSFSTLLCTRFP